MDNPAPESDLNERRVGSGPIGLPVVIAQASMSATPSLKRSASEAFDGTVDDDDPRHKKQKEGDNSTQGSDSEGSGAGVDGGALAESLEEELQCGCCAAIVYRPVVVSPCQHFFCGSCVMLWIKNGGTSCPACRAISSNVSFSRPLEKVVDTLLRHAPGKARSVSERMQADSIYHPGVQIRIPSPRQASPEPSLSSANGMYLRPCPNCIPGNQWGWRCPQPIVDPDVDPTNAWPIDEGSPPGHGICGNCENVLALQGPSTTRCDFCQVSFCGINVPNRCAAGSIASAHPHGLTDLSDLIQCGEVFDCFEGNSVEVDIMLDYLSAQGLTPRHIYREIIQHIQSQPRQFAPLIELELFMDVHPVSGGIDPDPSAPRSRICRVCAAEILLNGLRDWWIRERKKGFLEPQLLARPDCPDGTHCQRQKLHTHAREFNHVIAPPDPHPPAEPAPPQLAPAHGPDTRSAIEFPPLQTAIPAPPPSHEPAHGPRIEPGAFSAAIAAATREREAPLPPALAVAVVAHDAHSHTNSHSHPHSHPTPVAQYNVEYRIDLGDYGSAQSSQDIRDEVDALL